MKNIVAYLILTFLITGCNTIRLTEDDMALRSALASERLPEVDMRQAHLEDAVLFLRSMWADFGPWGSKTNSLRIVVLSKPLSDFGPCPHDAPPTYQGSPGTCKHRHVNHPDTQRQSFAHALDTICASAGLDWYVHDSIVYINEAGKIPRQKKPQQERRYDKSISRSQALDIAEATFRYQFQNNASGMQQKADTYYLSLFGQDPSDGFLKRFADHSPAVSKRSQFAIGKGLTFRVSGIHRVDETTVEVYGGYYEDKESSSACTYTLNLIDKKWVVSKRVIDLIS